MPNYQLYKQRKFNDYLNDTIQFFRQFGGDYFKKFFLVNGGIILVVCVLLYFAARYFTTGKLKQDFAYGIGDGWGTVLIFGLISLVAGLAYTVFSFGFPNAYFDTLEENNPDEKASPSDILKSIGHIAGDVLLFLVISLFIFLPFYIILAIVSKVLMPFVVGYFILAFGVCFLLTWFNLSLIVYVRDYYSGYFESLGSAWKMIIQNFKHILGANVVLFLILYIVQTLVTFVPSMIASLLYLSSGRHLYSNGFFVFIGMTYVLMIITASVISNMFFVQQFLIYFSSVEKEENVQAINDLYSIGQHED